MADIVDLHGRPIDGAKCEQHGVVAVLEMLLEKAKAGDIVAIAYVTLNHDNWTGDGFSHWNDYRLMLGSIDLLKHRALCEMQHVI